MQFTYRQQQIPPVWRGVIKVALAVGIMGAMYGLADLLLWALAQAGQVDEGTYLPRSALEYGLAAILFTYQPQPDALRRSVLRRFIAIAVGILIGALFWGFVVPGPIAVLTAVAAGWTAGVFIGGTAISGNAAFFAGITALDPSDDVLVGLATRLSGTLVGFVAVYLVVVTIWPTDEPEEPRRLIG